MRVVVRIGYSESAERPARIAWNERVAGRRCMNDVLVARAPSSLTRTVCQRPRTTSARTSKTIRNGADDRFHVGGRHRNMNAPPARRTNERGWIRRCRVGPPFAVGRAGRKYAYDLFFGF